MSLFAALSEQSRNLSGQEWGRTADTATAALRGETHNTGVFTLPAGSEEYGLFDPRMGAGRLVLLSPLDAGAAALGWWVDESTIIKGGVTIKFLSAPGSDCRFGYAVVGVFQSTAGSIRRPTPSRPPGEVSLP
jgi:hypothetical protein